MTLSLVILSGYTMSSCCFVGIKFPLKVYRGVKDGEASRSFYRCAFGCDLSKFTIYCNISQMINRMISIQDTGILRKSAYQTVLDSTTFLHEWPVSQVSSSDNSLPPLLNHQANPLENGDTTTASRAIYIPVNAITKLNFLTTTPQHNDRSSHDRCRRP